MITNTSNQTSRLRQYNHRVEALYQKVSGWLHGYAVDTSREPFTKSEEIFGEYVINKCKVKDGKGSMLLLFEPIGASIIGADGRVDIIGRISTHTLVYLRSKSAVSPTMTSPIKTNQGIEEMRNAHRTFPPPIFSKADTTGTGWYWVNKNAPRTRIERLTKKLFMDIFSDATGYELESFRG